jgi:leucyl/phenylalanyl-tRNA--protein transferase
VIDLQYLIAAYAQGAFPMGLEDGEIGWFSPDPRGILPLDTFHYSSRLARVMRQRKFQITVDTDFAGVMRACAEHRDEGTWITGEILESYTALHARGLAHSVEARQDGRLVGGLYGVHLGAAFFGESMFHTVTDASKVALAALVDLMRANGFTLLDTQWTTPHLAQFGGVEIPRDEYLVRLADALGRRAAFVRR